LTEITYVREDVFLVDYTFWQMCFWSSACSGKCSFGKCAFG